MEAYTRLVEQVGRIAYVIQGSSQHTRVREDLAEAGGTEMRKCPVDALINIVPATEYEK